MLECMVLLDCIAPVWPRFRECTRKKRRDFSGGPVVKSSPALAGDMGLTPGKIPHATEELSPCT